ncbi:MAG TPA: Stk1 family PASTA domain-containing Ser/Thr kinase [Firmicutes bacterium]|mgnify:CR=1 FL=1|jgi:serine/threonine-protein kinase|nr:Stk1 family PASTA domain-containing Ser/Thr kinase [Bacillota bacterium]HCX70141.1 Stk1 family PASTA domain-containing Ser/Thr kinase [Bacillota bacterium]
MIGSILGNRYRILELVGEGGMALVYKAECSLLNREVAVKVLRPQYASDAEFVERFRREAQAAASLSHPNVVNIYDVGQQDDIHYIVMEYVRGENLKDIIRRNAPLPIHQALNISRQIAEALYHAHQNNIVHRDIKPQNILLTRDGRVKVTDFGIAKAISSSSVTQTGVVMGSVQYFSPEQARGIPAGHVSDIYALGCVMYELLTGSVPFKGDSPIAVALKHIQDNPVPPRQIRPGIPIAVEAIVMKALEKNKERRYQSAQDLANDIRRAEGQNMTNQTDDLEATRILNEVRIPKNNRKFPWLIAGILAVILPLIGFLIYLLWPQSGPAVKVPDVSGYTVSQGREVLERIDLRLNVIAEDFSEAEPGIIFFQDKRANSSVRRNTIVGVKVSKGPELVTVPDLRGLTEKVAYAEIENAQLLLGTVNKEPSDSYAANLVIRQIPEPGEQIPRGGKIDIIISEGQRVLAVEVPYLDGLLLEQAVEQLEALGLIVGRVVYLNNPRYAAGVIYEQHPVAGETVPPGTAVDFTVSGTEEQRRSGSGDDDGDDDAAGGIVNSLDIRVPIPAGQRNQRLQIVVRSESGSTQEVYSGVHQPGETFSRTIQARGHGTLLVFINDVKIKEYRF